MSWSNIAGKVSDVAPLLGGLLGGPIGAIAGAAGKLIASTLGVKDDPKVVEEALNAQSLLKLKQLEHDERDKILDIQKMQLQFELENVKSAREREIALSDGGKYVGWLSPLIVAVGVIVSFGGCLYATFTMQIAEGMKELLLIIVGALAAQMNTVVSYYLGSSLGSTNKDKYLYKSTPL